MTLWFAQQQKLDPGGQLCVKNLQHTDALQVISLGKPPQN
jgi:hypothetical protein